ncbi:hypothetical protein C2845_PM01G39300 [Panicum miliaceum]|uniref:Uncharacterized protein n=1 Tax=Panicum miliaceum TaxID=4540 RepID=A0A3L6TI26_PANMI|nr:hypothetical protein C2845_PM01G39300 [Panicum miliaceum]
MRGSGDRTSKREPQACRSSGRASKREPQACGSSGPPASDSGGHAACRRSGRAGDRERRPTVEREQRSYGMRERRPTSEWEQWPHGVREQRPRRCGEAGPAVVPRVGACAWLFFCFFNRFPGAGEGVTHPWKWISRGGLGVTRP